VSRRGPTYVSLLLLLCGCTSHAASTRGATTRGSTPTSQLRIENVISTLPVVPCNTTFGVEQTEPWFPRRLAVSVPSAQQRGLSFYSNGFITLLGPRGWACSALVAGDGGQALGVYPPGNPDPTMELPRPGSELVLAETDYTGHGPGEQLACGLFRSSEAHASMQNAGMLSECAPPPDREADSRLTNDIVQFDDPPGVRGSSAGSGGRLPGRGVLIYPQSPSTSPSGVNVAKLSCTLGSPMANLCPTLIGDFVARSYPRSAP
jgi:hypothetical protein